MENLQEQNDQTPAVENQQEPANQSVHTRLFGYVEKEEIDFDSLDDIPCPVRKQITTDQEVKDGVLTITSSTSIGANSYHDDSQPTKKKRPAKDIFPGFYISVNNGIMKFFFSRKGLDIDTRFSQGTDYWCRRFALFSEAIAFYEENFDRYICERSVQKIKSIYKKEWNLFNNPTTKQPGAMW